MARSTLLLLSLVLLACEPAEPPPPAPFPARIELSAPPTRGVAVGEPVTFEAKVLNADGSSSSRSGLRVLWFTQAATQVESRGPQGEHRVEVTHAEPGTFSVTVRAEVVDESGVVQWTAVAPTPPYEVWGGPTVSLVKPLLGSVSLVVGERRPLLVFPIAARSLSSEPVTWSSSNQAVATVSPSGEVRGLTMGTTQVTARSGSSSVTFDVTVTAGAPGPPTDGLWKLPIDTTALAFTGLEADLPLRGTVDAQGWPAVVVQMTKVTWGSAPVLVRWTGSGWGAERIVPGWANFGPCTVLVDGDELVFAMMPRGEQKLLVIARRPLAGPAGEWSVQSWPVELALLKRLGIGVGDYGQEVTFLSARRAGPGALFVTWFTTGDFPGPLVEKNFGSGLLEGECSQAQVLALVNANGVRGLEERHEFFPRGLRSLSDCDVPFSLARFAAPGVKADGGATLDLGQMPWVPSARWRALSLPGTDGGWPERQFTFEMSDRLMFRNGTSWINEAWIPPGELVAEDSSAPWADPGIIVEPETSWAFAAGERSVVLAFRHVENNVASLGLGTSRLPPLPDFGENETTGERVFGDEVSPPVVTTRPLVLSNGTRLLVAPPRPALGDPGGIERSVARAPFVRVAGFDLTFSAQWALASSATDVFAVGPRMGGMAVSRSTDQGATWQALVAFPRMSPRGELVVFSNGAALATTEGRLFFSPGLLARQGFVEVTTTPSGTFLDTSLEMSLHQLPGDLVGVIARLSNPNPRVWWRVLRNDGTVEREWQVPCGTTQQVAPAAVMPDGGLVLVSGTSAALQVSRAEQGATSLSTVALPNRAWAWLLPITSSGGVVFGGEYRDGFRGVAAAFSSDGVMSAPEVPLRPDGGNFQTVLSVFAEGAELGFIVLDNGGIAGGTRAVQTPDSLAQSAGVPLLLRRAAP